MKLHGFARKPFPYIERVQLRAQFIPHSRLRDLYTHCLAALALASFEAAAPWLTLAARRLAVGPGPAMKEII